MAAILKITDGITSIDLLDPTGFHLYNWRPVSPEIKDGGTWSDVATADGRILRAVRYSNIIETYELKMRAPTQEESARKMSDLRRLLGRASKYWSYDSFTRPVYLVRRSTNETQTSYAVIYQARIPEDENPFASPFLQPGCNTVQDDLSLIIEHDIWRNLPPDTSEAILAGTYQGTTTTGGSGPVIYFGNMYPVLSVDSGSGNYGRPLPTTVDGEVVVSNCEYFQNIHTIVRRTSAGVWTNISYDEEAYLWLPGSAATSDVYLGIGPTLIGQQHGLLQNVVMTSILNDTTSQFSWTYWDGVSWSAIPGTVYDGTDHVGAGISGPNMKGVVSFGWAFGSIPSPTSLSAIVGGAPATANLQWIRARKTDANAGYIQLQKYFLRTANVPYVTVESFGGDFTTLGEIDIMNATGVRHLSAPAGTPIHTVYMFACPYSVYNPRGDDSLFTDQFTPFINFTDPGIDLETGFQTAVSVTPSITAPPGTDPRAATGRSLFASVVAGAPVGNELRATIVLDPVAYIGRYRLFVRYSAGLPAGSPVVESRLEIEAGDGLISQTESIRITSAQSDHYMVDMGVITLPPYATAYPGGLSANSLTMRFYLRNSGTGTATIALHDLILWPVDVRGGVNAALRSPISSTSGMRNGTFIRASSIYKNATTATVGQAWPIDGEDNFGDPFPGEKFFGSWLYDSSIPVELPNDEPYRIYFMSADYTNWPIIKSYPYQTLYIRIGGARRYATSAAGDRR